MKSMVRAISGVPLKGKKRSMDLMFILGLNETIDKLAMANSVCWYSQVLRREDGYILRRAFDFEVDSQGKKGRPKRTWKKQVEEEGMMTGLWREGALCPSMWIVNINLIAIRLYDTGHPHLLGILLDSKHWFIFVCYV